jgi:hypothetical protein
VTDSNAALMESSTSELPEVHRLCSGIGGGVPPNAGQIGLNEHQPHSFEGLGGNDC